MNERKKQCLYCDKVKPLSRFYYYKLTGTYGDKCNVCQQKKSRKRYYEKNKERWVQYSQEWNKENREKRNEYAAVYRQRHREQLRTYNTEYQRKRRARLKAEVQA